MRASPAAKTRNAAGNRARRGLWAVAFLTLALLAAVLARETARSLKGAQPRQVERLQAPQCRRPTMRILLMHALYFKINKLRTILRNVVL
jgi:hypothetical protein